MAGTEVKLPLFHGNGTKDLEQYWFLCEVVSAVRKTVDDDVKKGKLATTPCGHALIWYMNIIQVRTGTPRKTLEEFKRGLIEDIRKPKSKVQYIIELKEIKQYPNEAIQDLDQRFKTLMAKLVLR